MNAILKGIQRKTIVEYLKEISNHPLSKTGEIMSYDNLTKIRTEYIQSISISVIHRLRNVGKSTQS